MFRPGTQALKTILNLVKLRAIRNRPIVLERMLYFALQNHPDYSLIRHKTDQYTNFKCNLIGMPYTVITSVPTVHMYYV